MSAAASLAASGGRLVGMGRSCFPKKTLAKANTLGSHCKASLHVLVMNGLVLPSSAELPFNEINYQMNFK